MVQCRTCGTLTPDTAGKCTNCGTDLKSVFAAAVGDETVAMPPSESSRPRSSSTVSRLTTTSIPDEGRFVPGTLVAGRYRIIALLGRGGMGEVYRATDLTLGQSVALKFLPDEAAGNERLLERFHSEVRIARQVSHANVCRVYDIGQADGVPFMSMEYVDGEDLACLLQRIGRMPSDKALEIARKLCAGVAAAHERGIIHRDLKPQNVMLDRRGEVVIMDFGLAAVADELQGAEARNGTPAYMAPEQLRGDSVTSKSDLYSLGLIVYELFTGRRAFAEARSAQDLLRLEESTRPATITSLAPDVDPAVEKIIGRCLHPDPAQRPHNALSIAAALPGGDPLAAALAAGETPSPELVAASGKTEGFAPRYAVPCLAFILGSVIGIPFFAEPMSMLAVAPMDFPPAVLDQKARDFAASAGYSARPVDWTGRLRVDGDMVAWFEKHRGSTPWARVMGAASPIEYSYRQSPDYLLAPPDGAVKWDRPPVTFPGMVNMVLDSRGRLRAFEAVAPRYDEKTAPPATDPAAVFRQAGLDIAQFHDAQPQYAPALAFDARRAWTGTYPDLPNVPITVEAATWRGALTSFVIRWPWTKPPQATGNPRSLGELASSLIPVLFLACGLFSAVLLARRNVRLGRGDRQGAFRVASAAFLFFAILWACDLHVVPRLDLIGYGFVDIGLGLMLSSIVWLVYMALEPAMRARWPHSMITWNRMLAGRFGDPRLGSHVLIGMTVAMAFCVLFTVRQHWRMAAGAAPYDVTLDPLLGVLPLIARIANIAFNALLGGITIFFLLSGMRALLRRDSLAAIAAAILMTLVEANVRQSPNLAIDIPLYLALYTLFMFILLRMGLVPAVIMLFVLNLGSSVPIGAEFSSWFNWAAVLLISIIAGLAVFAFWRSQSPAIPHQRSSAFING